MLLNFVLIVSAASMPGPAQTTTAGTVAARIAAGGAKSTLTRLYANEEGLVGAPSRNCLRHFVLVGGREGSATGVRRGCEPTAGPGRRRGPRTPAGERPPARDSAVRAGNRVRRARHGRRSLRRSQARDAGGGVAPAQAARDSRSRPREAAGSLHLRTREIESRHRVSTGQQDSVPFSSRLHLVVRRLFAFRT